DRSAGSSRVVRGSSGGWSELESASDRVNRGVVRHRELEDSEGATPFVRPNTKLTTMSRGDEMRGGVPNPDRARVSYEKWIDGEGGWIGPRHFAVVLEAEENARISITPRYEMHLHRTGIDRVLRERAEREGEELNVPVQNNLADLGIGFDGHG